MAITSKEVKSMSEILKLSNLKIPDYQRPYKWTEKNVLQLLEDLLEAMNENKNRYRIGTLILHQEKDESNLNIVDGQQRMVTISLILHHLGMIDKDNPILSQNFNHETSKYNIKTNYEAIAKWFEGWSEDKKSKFKNYVLEDCELVKIVLDDISEAFQFFDSQNARGKALEPYDLLKAFHLREMADNTEEERLHCVKEWEDAVEKGSLKIIGIFLYRIRKWSRGENAYWFSKDDIDEFKGINIEKCKTYPYLQPYLINDTFTKYVRQNSIANYLQPKFSFPFQINQMIINGKLFFEYVDFYADYYYKLFHQDNETEFYKFYKEYCFYNGSNRSGDGFVREMFEASILFYLDKFGENEFEKVKIILYKWAYLLRLKQLSVKYASVDKYIREEGNIFKEIHHSYLPNVILRKNIEKVETYKIEKVLEVFNLKTK